MNVSIQDPESGFIKQIYVHLNSPNPKQTSPDHSKFYHIIANNMALLYESIKTLSFIFTYQLEIATDNLLVTALDFTSGILSTCSLPAINLIESYLLPIFTKISQKYANWVAGKTGQEIEKNKNKNQVAKKCVQIIIIWSGVKPKRIIEEKQINQSSDFYQSLEIVCGEEADHFLIDLRKHLCKHLMLDWGQISVLVKQFRKTFLSNLQSYMPDISGQYSEFFLEKMLKNFRVREKQTYTFSKKSIIMRQIMNPQNLPIEQMPPLDPKVLYETLDPVLTTRLIQSLYYTLEKDPNFENKRESIAMFIFLLKCGDVEAFCLSMYCDLFQIIAERLLEVNGWKSLEEGKNVFPELGPVSGKQQFYVQYLRFLDNVSIWIEHDSVEDQNNISKLGEIYATMKKRKFIFPQNLIRHKIHENLAEALSKQEQRNNYVLAQLQQIQSTHGAVSNLTSKLHSQLAQFFQEGNALFDQLLRDENVESARKTISELRCFISDLNHEEWMIESANEDQPEDFKQIIRQSETIKKRYSRVIEQWELLTPQSRTSFQFFKKVVTEGNQKQDLIINESSRNINHSLQSQKTEKKKAFEKASKKILIRSGTMNRIAPRRSNSVYLLNQSRYGDSRQHDIDRVNRTSQMQYSSMLNDKSRSSLKNFWIQIPEAVKKLKPMIITPKFNRIFRKQSNHRYEGGRIDTITQEPNESVDSDIILQPNLCPKQHSVLLQNQNNPQKMVSSVTSFKDCLSVDKSLIKHGNYAKSYLKQKSSIFQRDTKSSMVPTPTASKQKSNYFKQQSQISENNKTILFGSPVEQIIQENTILENNVSRSMEITKQNPIPDPKIGRLIRFQQNECAFLKETRVNKQFYNEKICVFKNLNIEISLNYQFQGQTWSQKNHSQPTVKATLLVIPNIFMKSLNVELFTKKDPSISIKLQKEVINNLQPGQQYEINLTAQLINSSQKKLPEFVISYSTEHFTKQVYVEIPISILNFAEHEKLKSQDFLIRDPKYRVIRSQKFATSIGQKLSQQIKFMRLVYRGQEGNVYAAQGQLNQTRYQLFAREQSRNLIIFGVLQSGKNCILEDIISILRYSLMH